MVWLYETNVRKLEWRCVTWSLRKLSGFYLGLISRNGHSLSWKLFKVKFQNVVKSSPIKVWLSEVVCQRRSVCLSTVLSTQYIIILGNHPFSIVSGWWAISQSCKFYNPSLFIPVATVIACYSCRPNQNPLKLIYECKEKDALFSLKLLIWEGASDIPTCMRTSCSRKKWSHIEMEDGWNSANFS